MFEIDFLSEIGTGGIVVFQHICKHSIRYGNDTIIIIIEDIMSRTKYNSAVPIYKGIAALIEHKVLARTASLSVYWLNPAIIYKGERWYLNK